MPAAMWPTSAAPSPSANRGTLPASRLICSPPTIATTSPATTTPRPALTSAASPASPLPTPSPAALSDPQSLNAYSYVESDPANLADPLGLCPSPGICITVSAPYWPSGPSLPSTSAVFFGGAGPDDINAEGQIFARTGRGNSSGGGFFSRLGNRLACAAEFGDAHSLAAATGTQDSFLGKAFLGNTFSGLTQLGL